MTINPYAGKRNLRLYEAEFSPEAISKRFGISENNILDFSLNINPFGPSPKSLVAARDELAFSGKYPDIHLKLIRQQVSLQHNVSEGMIAFGAGLDEVLKLITQAWSSPEENAVIHIPTFPRYELECKLHGLNVVSVSSKKPWDVDMDKFGRVCQEEHPALAFICTPNNPTGGVISVNDIKKLVTSFPETIFVVDEALINPSEDGAIELARLYANVAILRTFSKYYGLAGYRIGYVIACDELIKSLEIARPPFNVSAISAAAASAAMGDVKHLNYVKSQIAKEASFFVLELERMGNYIVRGCYSNMILLELTSMTSEDLCSALAVDGFIVADGKSFKGLEDVETVRISIKDRNSNMKLLSALAKYI